jgi:predicted permease
MAASVWFWWTMSGVILHVVARRSRDSIGRTRLGGFFGRSAEWRQAFRALRRAPWYSLTVIAVIALSTALATTVFAVVDGVLFKALPYPNPDALYDVAGGFSARPGEPMQVVSFPDTRAWIAAIPEARFTMMNIGDAVLIADNDYWRVAKVDRTFFDVVGVRPMLGGFSDADFGPASKVRPAIVTYEIWQNRLGGTPAALGRLLLDASGNGARVVGVMPPGFLYPHPAGRVAPEALLPLPPPSATLAADPSRRYLQILTRVPLGANLTDLEGRLGVASRDVARRFPPLPDDPSISAIRRITRGPFDAVTLRPLRGVMVAATHSFAAASFFVAAGLLLLGALNLAGLAAGRAIDRQRELALRVALGGGGTTVVRLFAMEHAIVVTTGAAIGVAAAPFVLAVTTRLLPAGLMLLRTPAIDARVIVFGVLATVMVIAIVTAWSARSALTTGLRPVLADEAGSTSRIRSRGRAWLIGVQVAIALVLSLGGALQAASLVRVWQEDPGYRIDRVAKIRVNAPSAFSTDMLSSLLDTIDHVPGVLAAGGLDEPFLERAITGSGFEKPAGALPTGDVEKMTVTWGFFPAAGLIAVEGRLPSRDEFDRGSHVIVVSRKVAASFWPGRSAVGQTLLEQGQVFDVIGVVPDIRHASLDRESDGEIYSSRAAQQEGDLLNLLVAFDAPVHDPLARVVAAMSAGYPGVRIVRVEMLADALGASVQFRRFQAWLFVAFGTAALAIVGVGMLGAIAMAVARRTREVGIRMALGARWTSVAGLVLREQLRSVVLGVFAGAIVSLWLVQFLGQYLYKMTAYDWSAWTSAIAALLVVAFGAALVPALRASRVDPVQALREN